VGCESPRYRPAEAQHLFGAVRQGSRLIVIDPAETALSRKAHLWVKPRPGTDLALALAVLNVIIHEGLYDKTFVEKWTTGLISSASLSGPIPGANGNDHLGVSRHDQGIGQNVCRKQAGSDLLREWTG